MRRKIYKEGNWFAVPISSGYVLGRISRVGSRGGILLGYFFEPIFETIPTLEDAHDLKPEQAFYIVRFCDPGLNDLTWPIIGNTINWNREEWPIPQFGRIGSLGLSATIITYDEKYLAIATQSVTATVESTILYPDDGLFGHLALQDSIEQYFKIGPGPHFMDEPQRSPFWYRGLIYTGDEENS